MTQNSEQTVPATPGVRARLFFVFLLPNAILLTMVTGLTFLAAKPLFGPGKGPEAGSGMGPVLILGYGVAAVLAFIVAPSFVASLILAFRRWKTWRSALIAGCVATACATLVGAGVIYFIITRHFMA